jgi:ABC-type antimicrobial peptide transport system permease subunit
MGYVQGNKYNKIPYIWVSNVQDSFEARTASNLCMNEIRRLIDCICKLCVLALGFNGVVGIPLQFDN